MTFDAMRRHRKKIQIPLAVVVSIIFIFFFGAAGGIGNLLRSRRGPSGSLEEELLRTGYDLKSAQLMYVPEKLREWVTADVKRRFAGELKGLPPKDYDKKLSRLVNDEVRAWYRSTAARQHYLPFKMAEQLGVRISDEELAEEVRDRAKLWSGGAFDPKLYHEQLASWGLSPVRFEELLREQILADRAEELALLASGPSEAEMFAAYCRDRQKVRVQYFQRRPGEFLGLVKVLPGKRPEEKKAEKKPEEKKAAGEKKPADAGKKAGSENAEPKKKKKEEKKAVEKFIYEGDVEKRYKKVREDLEKAYRDKDKPDAEIEWSPYLSRRYPELFSEPRARVEYLVALGKSFQRKVKVTEADIKKYYNNNPDLFRQKPKTGQPAGRNPPLKPLNRKLREEIRKKLLERDAKDLAMVALTKAVTAYNRLTPEKRKSLKDFARGHGGVDHGSSRLGTLDELEEAKHLGLAKLDSFFNKTDREKLAGKLSDPGGTEKEDGHVAVRLAEFKPIEFLELKQARPGLTYRLKYERAWDLAKEAVGADREALEKGKLAAARVRESILLGPDSEMRGDETCRKVARHNLAVGEASLVYIYSQALGEEAEKEKRKAEAEKEKEKEKKAKKPLEERIREGFDRGDRGYRVVVLLERKPVELEKFRADVSWRAKWQRRMPDWRRRRMMPSDDDLWRQAFTSGWRAQMLLRLSTEGG